jgi:type I restriction enzyme S subunit
LSPSEAAGARLAVGDLVVTKSSGSELHIGKTSLVTPEVAELGACYSNFMQRLRLDSRTAPRFVHYWMNNELCREQFAYLSNSTSGLANLNGTVLGTARLAFPPLAEQQRIANFLDEKTARIDALIAEKERLTKLLLEEEQSCIDGAVLGGQAPLSHFPFTPPTCAVHGVVWRRVALKRCWQVTDCKHLTVDFVEDGFPLASIREVSGSVLELCNAKRARQEDYLNLIEGGRQPRRGDLIYARNASVGAAAYVDTDEPFAMGQDVCLISSADQDQRFLRLQLMSSPVKAQLEGLLVGATIRRINVEQLRNFVVLVPPPDVQREVVQAAEAQLARRAELRAHLAEHINVLREYRSSLISAAVTGQLNIYDFKARPLEAA